MSDAAEPETASTSADHTGDEAGTRRTLLFSRAVVTWVELALVGFAGAALSASTAGPPRLVVYLATTLVSVVVLLYNVDRLVAARTR